MFNTKLVATKKLSDNIKKIKLEKPKGFEFKPGNFVFMKYKGSQNPYSIASSPKDPQLTFLIKKVNKYGFSKTIHELTEGEKLKISENKGKYFYEKEKSFNLVHTGLGIAPNLSIYKYAKQTKRKPDINVVSINQNEFFWQKLENETRIKMGNNSYIDQITGNIIDSKIYYCGQEQTFEKINQKISGLEITKKLF